MKPMTDEQLVSLIKKNPDKGIAVALELYAGQVKTICMAYLSGCSPEDIEETIADCFVMLWKSIGRFDPQKGYSLKSYLYGIARKTAISWFRKHRPGETLLLDEEILKANIDIENETETREAQQILHAVVDAMDEPDRSVFILRFFYNQRVAEIARRLQISQKRVENGLYRGKEKLRIMLLKRGIES